ncbi:MAG: GNAT family N-acetyltransferase [Candidatus Heimdallarchaeota archaeon]|nr:MAG: GNAT family N-acetyltransferase [Candidatus Heimdallarchaeota archaeon]
MGIRILSITEKYYKNLEEMYTNVFGEFDSSTDQTNFRRYIRFRSNLIKIAAHSSKVVGCIIGSRDNFHKARVYFLYVLPNFQRRLIGSDLLQKLEMEFRTNQSNLRYISVRIPEKFFDSKGFFMKHRYEIITKINCYVKKDLHFPFQANPNLEIRLATENDLKNLIKLEHACFSEYWRKTKEDFKGEIESKVNILLIALLDGILVGYNSSSISANGTNGHYARIATLPEFRKQHIATSLTAQAFHWFQDQKVRNVLLTTFAESEAHNLMYKKWGFEFEEQELILAKKIIT